MGHNSTRAALFGWGVFVRPEPSHTHSGLLAYWLLIWRPDEGPPVDLDAATRAELISTESRAFARILDMLELGIQALQESQRFRTGPEADPERYKEAHAAYQLIQDAQQQLHAAYMAIHEEVQRRLKNRSDSPGQ
jgi:hypothetical protein